MSLGLVLAGNMLPEQLKVYTVLLMSRDDYKILQILIGGYKSILVSRGIHKYRVHK